MNSAGGHVEQMSEPRDLDLIASGARMLAEARDLSEIKSIPFIRRRGVCPGS